MSDTLSLVQESHIGFRLCSRNELEEETHCSVIGLVHGIERKDESTILFSLALQNGEGCTVDVNDVCWRTMWKDIVRIGKIVALHGYYCVEDVDTFYMVRDIRSVSPTIYTFIHTKIDIPRTPIDRRMIVVRWDAVYSQPTPQMRASDIIAVCETGDMRKIWIVFHHSSHNRVMSFVKGAIIHIGPLRIDKSDSIPLGLPPLTHGVQFLIGTTFYHTVLYENI